MLLLCYNLFALKFATFLRRVTSGLLLKGFFHLKNGVDIPQGIMLQALHRLYTILLGFLVVFSDDHSRAPNRTLDALLYVSTGLSMTPTITSTARHRGTSICFSFGTIGQEENLTQLFLGLQPPGSPLQIAGCTFYVRRSTTYLNTQLGDRPVI